MAKSGHQPYQYRPLENNEIRLLDLLPGKNDDDIAIHLYHWVLPAQRNHPDVVDLIKADIERTLPQDCWVYRTPEGRWVFEVLDDSYVTGSRITFEHPSLPNWRPPTQEDTLCYPYEAISYVWGSIDQSKTAYVAPGDAGASEDSANFSEASTHEYSTYADAHGIRSDTRATSCFSWRSFDHPRFCISADEEREQIIQITESLDVAIRALRSERNTRTLWIDAICINQADIQERAVQVPRMGHIYCSARAVLAWIGPSTEHSGKALAALELLGRQVEISEDGFKMASVDAEHHMWHDQQSSLPWTADQWTAVTQLLSRPWFHRLWVVQEVTLARDAIIRCGNDEICFYHFRRAVAALTGKPNISMQLAQQLLTHREMIYGPKHLNPDDLIYTSRPRGCADLHDKIYAVMCMLSQDLRDRINPDYSRHFTEAYKELFLHTLSSSGHLDLLQECCPVKEGSTMPSWVPDWSIDLSDTRSRFPRFRSSSQAVYKYDDSNPGVLEVRGRVTSIIATISVPLAATADSAGCDEYLHKVMPEHAMTGIYPTGESVFDAWLRTLRMNLLKDRLLEATGEQTLEAWKNDVLARIADTNGRLTNVRHDLEELPGWIGRIWRRNKFFTTDDGLFGFGPLESRRGDRIAMVLGLESPILLHPEAEGTFSVVGPVYVHGLMDGEALYDWRSDQWVVQLKPYNRRYNRQFTNRSTGVVHEADPRLPLRSDLDMIQLI